MSLLASRKRYLAASYLAASGGTSVWWPPDSGSQRFLVAQMARHTEFGSGVGPLVRCLCGEIVLTTLVYRPDLGPAGLTQREGTCTACGGQMVLEPSEVRYTPGPGPEV